MKNLIALSAVNLLSLVLYIGQHIYVIYLKISCFVTVYDCYDSNSKIKPLIFNRHSTIFGFSISLWISE